MGSGNRRLTLFEQMSAVDNGRNNLAGLTLDDILGKAKRPEQTPVQKRTLLEIIRDDVSNKDKKSWQTFRDKLLLKRAGSAWTSSVPIPASDVNVHSNRSQFSRHGSFRYTLADSTRVEGAGESVPISDPPVNSRMQLARRVSVRFGNNPTQIDYDDSVNASMPSDGPPSRSFRPQITRHPSTRLPTSNTDGGVVVDSRDDDGSPLARDRSRQLGVALAEERALSAREAVAAEEAAAAEQTVAAQNNASATGTAEEPVRMSLMDLLGETGYTMGDDEYDDEEEEEQEEEEDVVVETSVGIEHACCICMVRHKGSAFIPCGHTFCRLCSRELMVQRGNCPICNGFILEILDIF